MSRFGIRSLEDLEAFGCLRNPEEKASHTDIECVSCHVVGAKDIGGFVTLEASPGFAGVQCENCHGPRKEHASNPTIKPISDPKGACIGCHKTPHSSSFKYDEYWPRVKHSY